MKYLVTLNKLNNIEKLSHADGFILGLKKYSTGITNLFTLKEVEKAINYCKKNNKELFLNLNSLYNDNELNKVLKLLKKLDLENINGLIISNIGLIYELSKINVKTKLIYNPETLLTNKYDFNLLKNDNIYGAFISKEISLNDILKITKNKKIKTFLYGHGYLSMFYSKRKLITNFYDKYKLKKESNSNIYEIIEQKRPLEKMKVLEDEFGFHIYRSNVLNSFKVIDKLREGLDYFIIDSIFTDDKYSFEILNLYKNGYNLEKINNLKKEYNQKWDDGFYFINTFYEGLK